MLATAAASASSPIAYWYLTRGTGVVALVLLTLTVALGVANVKRLQSKRIPRFVVDGLHRNVSMLAVVFLGVHIATTLLDSYAHVRLTDVVLPFAAGYKPFWIGLGTLSLDLMVAVMVTSLLRRRIGHRVWRATHWLAYASWPVALSHSLGSGTDASSSWMLALSAACVLVVAVAVAIRLRQAPTAPLPRLNRHPIRENVRRARRPAPARLATTGPRR
jgi:sulfoxide reductase heme-binding subunit YedZ